MKRFLLFSSLSALSVIAVFSACVENVPEGPAAVRESCQAPPVGTVDFGEGFDVLWGTANVGASSPGEKGWAFAWGETSVKAFYGWDSYLHCHGSSSSMCRYCTCVEFGAVDDRSVLEEADDAAAVCLGNGWRMPTAAQWRQLMSSTDWKWTDDYDGAGSSGYVVTSTRDRSVSMFLPAAGGGGSVGNRTPRGCYWTSELRGGEPSEAWFLFFSEDWRTVDGALRCLGYYVRPVRDRAETSKVNFEE